ncbi:MAG: flagellar basal body-associated FliL family protein [Pseudomonadota bacterium]
MGKLIPLLLLLIGLGGGVGAGLALKPAPEACAEDAEDCEKADKAGDEKASGDKKKDGGYGGAEYAELNRQFVVPIVEAGAVRALVVASLALEVGAGQSSLVFDSEPKLRDALLQVLFVHAHAGGFDGAFTSKLAMEDLRTLLNEAAAPILGEAFHAVLVTEIVRQDL